MKIAVLNISIGEYVVFWEDFYKSAQKNFMVDCEREFFVFTDKDEIFAEDDKHVHKIYQKDMGWPFNTMKRFHMFRGILDELKEFDYIFFANGNALFTYPLTSEILKRDLITVEHPGMHLKKVEEIPFERRKESNAYVRYGDEKKYVQGAFYGATFQRFQDMVILLDELTESDLEKNIIAVWHDESFLNYYVTYNDNIQILGWQYLKYEEFVLPYDGAIVLRDKKKWINKANGRLQGRVGIKETLKLGARNVKWYIGIKLGIIRRCYIKDEKNKYVDIEVGDDNR